MKSLWRAARASGRAIPVAIALAVAGSALAWHPRAAAAASLPTLGTLVWSDDFNGQAGAPPDTTKWNVATGYWNAASQQLECYTNSPDNVRLDGHGHLSITALYAPGTQCGGSTLNYTSGRIDTNQKFSVQYGTIQIRMRMPTAQGMWPAFWSVGVNTAQVGDPNGGEIDAVEAIGSDSGTSKVYGTLHGPDAGDPGYWSSGGTVIASSDLSQWHTYAISWQPGQISFLLDGLVYYTATSSSLPANDEWVFDSQPFYLILNLAVGGTWPGDPDASTTFPQLMNVAWVRVYSLPQSSPPSPAVSSPSPSPAASSPSQSSSLSPSPSPSSPAPSDSQSAPPSPSP